VQVREFHTTIATSVQQDAVADLMAPTEAPIGRPSLDIPVAGDILLFAPAEPVDEPGDDE
jgi:hypothetical protein